MSDAIKMGGTYRDKLHGTEGVATAVTEYLTGCTRVCVEYAKDGEVKCNWFDAPQLELVDEKPKAEMPEKPEDIGGPGRVAPSRDCPSR